MKRGYIILFITNILFLPLANKLNAAATNKSIGSSIKIEKFRYNGRDPFLNLEKLKILNNKRKSIEENNVDKNKIIARIRSISLVGTLTGKLGKRALILSDGTIYIVKVGDHIGSEATVVGIKNSLIKIKGAYKKGNKEKYVIVTLSLPK